MLPHTITTAFYFGVRKRNYLVKMMDIKEFGQKDDSETNTNYMFKNVSKQAEQYLPFNETSGSTSKKKKLSDEFVFLDKCSQKKFKGMNSVRDKSKTEVEEKNTTNAITWFKKGKRHATGNFTTALQTVPTNSEESKNYFLERIKNHREGVETSEKSRMYTLHVSSEECKVTKVGANQNEEKINGTPIERVQICDNGGTARFKREKVTRIDTAFKKSCASSTSQDNLDSGVHTSPSKCVNKMLTADERTVLNKPPKKVPKKFNNVNESVTRNLNSCNTDVYRNVLSVEEKQLGGRTKIKEFFKREKLKHGTTIADNKNILSVEEQQLEARTKARKLLMKEKLEQVRTTDRVSNFKRSGCTSHIKSAFHKDGGNSSKIGNSGCNQTETEPREYHRQITIKKSPENSVGGDKIPKEATTSSSYNVNEIYVKNKHTKQDQRCHQVEVKNEQSLYADPFLNYIFKTHQSLGREEDKENQDFYKETASKKYNHYYSDKTEKEYDVGVQDNRYIRHKEREAERLRRQSKIRKEPEIRNDLYVNSPFRMLQTLEDGNKVIGYKHGLELTLEKCYNNLDRYLTEFARRYL